MFSIEKIKQEVGTMKRNLFMSLFTLFLFLFSAMSTCFAVDEDPCKDQGITVRNLSFKDIWYKREGGSCTIVKRNYSFTIKPGEEMRLFSDSVCETPYCPECTYTYFKSYDANGNCRVKILLDDTISDM
jgi:hypothetical protein